MKASGRHARRALLRVTTYRTRLDHDVRSRDARAEDAT